MPPEIAAMVTSSVLFLSVMVLFVLRGPLGKALARRIEGRASQMDDQVLQAVEGMEGRMAELEERVARVHELEERLDFTERLLAQGRETARIEEGR
jgi:flagellar biosynthesis/type III secretory pathway M-ring protein FliF/YscJ